MAFLHKLSLLVQSFSENVLFDLSLKIMALSTIWGFSNKKTLCPPSPIRDYIQNLKRFLSS